MAKSNVDKRFDALLKAMTGPISEKPRSARQSSSKERDDDCSETRIGIIINLGNTFARWQVGSVSL